MVKLKVVRSDGYTIEAEGPADELVKLGLVPWYWNLNATYHYQIQNPAPAYGAGGVGVLDGVGGINGHIVVGK